MRVHAITHEGLVHDKNEDAHATVQTDEGGLLLVVCDGMGGMGRGDVASRLALDSLTAFMHHGAGFPPERLRRAIRAADIQVRTELCDSTGSMPGSTAVLLYVLDGMGHVAWVGDSRAYLVREGTLVERTRDHKLVSELVASGQLTEQEARSSTLAHVVTRALGGRPAGERPVTGSTLGHPWKFRRGDKVVLCSDGVCDLVDDGEISDLVRHGDPQEASRALLQLALERGGHDNITCIVGAWEGPDFEEDRVATPLLQPHVRLDQAADFETAEDELLEGSSRVTEEIDWNDVDVDEPRRRPDPMPVWLVIALTILATLVVVALAAWAL